MKNRVKGFSQWVNESNSIQEICDRSWQKLLVALESQKKMGREHTPYGKDYSQFLRNRLPGIYARPFPNLEEVDKCLREKINTWLRDNFGEF